LAGVLALAACGGKKKKKERATLTLCPRIKRGLLVWQKGANFAFQSALP